MEPNERTHARGTAPVVRKYSLNIDSLVFHPRENHAENKGQNHVPGSEIRQNVKARMSSVFCVRMKISIRAGNSSSQFS